ncbi:HNH endonuclease [Hymenobacter terrenus]|uniref:HNH endonuclease n=1 Tax=Hymenobacter terrenus TaxID=1629124 RepID=UPI002934ACC0|nr:HNH endonuclease [Hymenobacter terrenus]
MTGNRDADFKAANAAAGLADLVKSQGLRAVRPPEGYTWHHRRDFVATDPPHPPYGTCTMELVKQKAHRDTAIHLGSCEQCNEQYENVLGRKLYK